MPVSHASARPLAQDQCTRGRTHIEPASSGSAHESEVSQVLDYVWVRNHGDLDALVGEILSGARWYPIVGLTVRAQESWPAIEPGAVREIVGSQAPIYVIASTMTKPLQRELPHNLHVFGGAARIWWPIPRPGRDPHSHPLIYDPTGEYRQDVLEELAKAYASTRLPTRRSETLLERRCQDAEERARRTGEQLREAALERDQALRELHNAADGQTHSPTAEPADHDAAGAKERQVDPESRLHIEIREQWMRATSAADRRANPLGTYVLSEQILDDLARRRVGLPIDRVAWVLAMVASRRAQDLAGLSPHPLTTSPGGTQIVRADGAKGWRCTLSHISGGPRLHYWVHESGLIEFERVGQHDEL